MGMHRVQTMFSCMCAYIGKSHFHVKSVHSITQWEDVCTVLTFTGVLAVSAGLISAGHIPVQYTHAYNGDRK